MKNKIHPTYHTTVTATCACGNSFQTGSTDAEISVEVCYACHPFYTGKSKLIDTAGRVDKFQHRLKESKEKQKAAAVRKRKPKAPKPPQEVIRLS